MTEFPCCRFVCCWVVFLVFALSVRSSSYVGEVNSNYVVSSLFRCSVSMHLCVYPRPYAYANDAQSHTLTLHTHCAALCAEIGKFSWFGYCLHHTCTSRFNLKFHRTFTEFTLSLTRNSAEIRLNSVICI